MKKEKDKYEKFADAVIDEYSKGNVLFLTIEGPMVSPIKEFIKQPADGILYDLNRDEITILTMIKEHEKWVNDYAVAKTIRLLKEIADSKWHKVSEGNPEYYDDYLTQDELGVKQICHYNEEGWHSDNINIKYWMTITDPS